MATATKAKKSKKEVRTTHFTLRGEDFTRIVRDFLLSDNPGAAYRLITENLKGQGNIEKIAEQVLDGEKRFTGNETDGLGVAAERDAVRKAFAKGIHYIYAGRIRLDGKWYRPVAEVVAGDSAENCVVSGEVFRSVGDTEFIFEPCGEPPHWWAPHRSVKAAIKDFTSVGRTLEERGWPDADGGVYDNEASDDPDEQDDVEEYEESNEVRRERLRLEMAEQEAQDRAEREEFEARIAEYRKRILEQAHGDMLRLEWDGGHVDVPRVPFIRWAVERRKKLSALAPAWDNVCPSGMKLPLDSQNHSDWMIGAGLDLRNDYYNSPVQDAAVAKMFDIQQELASFQVAVLVEGTGYGYGKVVHGKPGKKPPKGSIVVLPNLGPKYVEAVVGASAVIAEAGGKTAHLAQVGLEQGLPIVVAPNALQRFPEGLNVSVDTTEGKIVLAGGDDW